MEWTFPTPPELDGPTVGDERALLAGYLGWQRRTLLNICAGLTGEQLAQRAVPTSALTLLGLVRHLTFVEWIWFAVRFGGRDDPNPFGGWDDDFDLIEPARAAEDLALFHRQNAITDEITAGLDLDATYDHRGQLLSLRFVHLHVIHEYARHNGHADLLREAVDGETGR